MSKTVPFQTTQLSVSVQFQYQSDKYLYPPSYGLNSTTTVLLEGGLWH